MKRVPFQSYENMAQTALNFLEKHDHLNRVPVDIDYLIELEGFILEPIPKLSKDHDIDGFLSSDLRHIYVDEYQYCHEYSYRFRFTIAHELAHYLLHRDLISKLGFLHPMDSQGGTRGLTMSECRSVEWQADMLAGMILVPEFALKEDVERLEKTFATQMHQMGSIDDRIAFLVQNLHHKYQVTDTVVKIRIEKEELLAP